MIRKENYLHQKKSLHIIFFYIFVIKYLKKQKGNLNPKRILWKKKM